MDTKPQKRTLQQNKSLHKYCTELANELNNSGIPLKSVMAKVHVDWSMEAVKSIWKAIGKAKFGKEHTSDFTTRELQDVYLEVNRLVSEYGIHMGFPSIENTDEALGSYKKYM